MTDNKNIVLLQQQNNSLTGHIRQLQTQIKDKSTVVDHLWEIKKVEYDNIMKQIYRLKVTNLWFHRVFFNYAIYWQWYFISGCSANYAISIHSKLVRPCFCPLSVRTIIWPWCSPSWVGSRAASTNSWYSLINLLLPWSLVKRCRPNWPEKNPPAIADDVINSSARYFLLYR